MHLRLFVPLLLASGLAWAQAPAQPPDLIPIPDGPPEMDRERSVSVPEVTIRFRDDRGMIEEYRAGGVLYMIRVNPARGAPYYLVDTDGDGNLETRFNDLAGGLLIPAWILFRW
jgi:hypothetical protein